MAQDRQILPSPGWFLLGLEVCTLRICRNHMSGISTCRIYVKAEGFGLEFWS